MSDAGSVRGGNDGGRRPRRKWSGRQIAAVILVIVIVIFAIANTQDATIDVVFDGVTLPLFVVIAGVGVIGFGAGWLVRALRDKR